MIEYRNILDVKSELQQRVREWRNSDRVRMNMLASDLISEEQHRRWLSSLAESPERQSVRVVFEGDEPFGIITFTRVFTRCRPNRNSFTGELFGRIAAIRSRVP